MTRLAQVRTVTYAVCNTGPLISAFQSGSFDLWRQIFAAIHLSPVCAGELTRHGWADAMQAAAPHLVIVPLTAEEEQAARSIAEQIAQHPDTNDPVVENHLGEAQAIALALRHEYENDILLLDERAARAVAQQQGVRLSGFPGTLLLAVQAGLIAPSDLKQRLEQCRQQGTHYSVRFIQQVYAMAQQK